MKSIFRFIYNLIPLKKYLFTLIKPLGISDNIVKHLVFNGPIKIKVHSGLSFKMYNKGYDIEQRLFWKGLNAWENNSNKIWMELAKGSTVIFDIGANTGIYTILAKTVNPLSKIYAIEPIVRIYDLLNTNIHLNNFNDIVTINKAISNENGKAVIQDVQEGVLYEASLEKGFAESRDYLVKNKTKVITHTVEVATLSSIIEQSKIDKIDLMKIDVETHEPSVMEGMDKYLNIFKPILIIEILNDSVATKLSKYFNNASYVFYNINEEKGYEKVESLSPSSHYNFIICPKEKENILLSALKNCV